MSLLRIPAHQLSLKLESLDAEFKNHHYSVVELISEEEELEVEQDIIDQHDGIVAGLEVRLQRFISTCSHHSTTQLSTSEA